MNRLTKKLVSGLISVSMLIAAVPAFVSADELPSGDLLFNATFDEAGTGSGSFAATVGGTVTEKGAVAYVDSWDGKSKALNISSKAAGNYLELADGLLRGKQAATFAFWLKADSPSVPNWPFMNTCEDLHNLNNEKYIGMLATSESFTVERYNNAGSRLSSVSAPSTADWQYVVAVYESSGTKLYSNGKLIASDSVVVDVPALFTTDSKTWIGHANWGSGEGFQGSIDDFRIYGKALSEDEIAALSAEGAKYAAAQLIADNNCYIADTKFYSGDEEIYTTSDLDGNLTIKSTINNYTAADGEATVSVYLNDAEEAAAEETAELIVSGGTAEVTVTVSPVAKTDTVTVKLTTPTKDDTVTDTVATLYGGVKAPVKAPADSDITTNGAHDPSIVKFPNDDTYYVYSSHHLIFTSEDLINWTKYDFSGTHTTNPDYVEISGEHKGEKLNANEKKMLDKSLTYMTANGYNNVNPTYWAPDVIYRPDDTAHPYWMYISVSCEVGGRNSVIALIKSDKPLFWADPEANIVDAGVVFATKENNSYKTNAIDANIYVDTHGTAEATDDTPYFIWGSFWGGIQAAPLTDEGLVEGVTYQDGNATLSSCQNFGTSIFTQKNGVAGPEGAWMIEHGDYRYAFTSYGWLGSNYNTRVAKSPLSTSFSTSNGWNLTDANGVTMYNQQSAGSTSTTTGYKMIGSYRLGDGSRTIALTNNNYAVQSGAGDAIVYYGPGHNSVINVGDESFYVSHARKNAVEIAATLQVRKMLWTADGWPVVSPVTYAGEVEQELPKDMIVGTYDLASVGRTKMVGSSINSSGSLVNRNYDLPVLSSKVTLNADDTMTNADGAEIGTWEFNGDHTVTLTFTATGDTSNNKDEFYKSGDVMTMYALFGYDKDEDEFVVGLTGVDQNHVTQLAKKSLSNVYHTKPVVYASPIVIEKSAGGNPILGFGPDGATLYAGDPAAFVDGDTVYIIAGHDTATNETYVMPEWVAYSSKDMKTWKYEGVPMKATDISWRSNDTSAWASQAVKYKDKYYLYYCTWTKTDSGKQSIGVAVADSPTGPYTDPLGAPLVKGSDTTPEAASHDDIDPTVYIETVDGVEHRYLCWGNTNLFICELNENMTSIKDIDGNGSIEMGTDIIHASISGAPASYTEAPWLYRQKDENGNPTGKYYLFYAMGWREQMAYATTDDLMSGKWQYGGLLMPPSATANTNHPAVIDFNGHTYFIYHNGALPWGSGFRRSVCVEEFTFNDDGTIDPIQETSTGLTGTASVITQGDDYIVHENFVNSSADGDYPISKSVSVGTVIADKLDAQWEIVQGKADASNDSYVSIQSVNKPGLYLAAQADNSVVLTQDSKQNDTDMKKNMTFRTMSALNESEDGVSFESVAMPGYYLTNSGGALTLTTGADADAATFEVYKAEEKPIAGMLATITDAWANADDGVNFYLNNAMLYGTVSVYAAEYKDDALIGVGLLNNVPVTSMRQSVKIDYARKEANSTLKIYAWKDMEPAAEPVTVTANENPYQIPSGYTSHYEFEDNLTDSVTSTDAVTVGWSDALDAGSRITTPKSTTASYADGYKGKALSMTGNGSDGVNLGKVITNGKYTIAFRMKANAFTQHTSGVFINSGTGSSENWVSAPFGWQQNGNTMIWSKNGTDYKDVTGGSMDNAWHQITIAADGTTALLYIDGVKVANGEVNNTVSDSTDTYLGVNFWDTPFNGLIDDLYIYNGTTLTDEQVTNLFEATK